MADIKTIETTDVTKTTVKEANSPLLSQDWKRWAKNAFIFSAPALLVFLIALQSGATLQQAGIALYGAAINAVIDFIKKYQAEVKYIPEK
jgi:hypothetical protein